jgi:hypothetical protein
MPQNLSFQAKNGEIRKPILETQTEFVSKNAKRNEISSESAILVRYR